MCITAQCIIECAYAVYVHSTRIAVVVTHLVWIEADVARTVVVCVRYPLNRGYNVCPFVQCIFSIKTVIFVCEHCNFNETWILFEAKVCTQKIVIEIFISNGFEQEKWLLLLLCAYHVVVKAMVVWQELSIFTNSLQVENILSLRIYMYVPHACKSYSTSFMIAETYVTIVVVFHST